MKNFPNRPWAWVSSAAAAIVLASSPALAATMSSSPEPPPRVGDDISNIPDLPPGATLGSDKWWVSSASSFGNPGMTVGQTFTTGNGAFLLKAVTFRIRNATEPSKTYTIRIGTVSGDTFTTVATETATQGFATADGDYWTWTFDTPVLLSPNTLYGVDVGLNSSSSAWQTGIPYVYHTTTDTYSGGTRFRSGSEGNGIGDDSISQTGDDRVFHLALERPLGETFELAATSPANGETGVLASRNLVLTFSQDVAPGTGDIVIRNLGDGTESAIPAGDPRLAYEENVLTITATGLLEWNTNYAVRIDSGAVLGHEDAPFDGIDDDTTWTFTTGDGDPLLVVIADLKDHINGAITLSAAQIEAHKQTIDVLRNRFPESADTISAVFDLVETYDAVVGPLWVARGQFPNRNNQPVDLDWTLYHVMQYIMDEIYTAPVLAEHEDLLEGFVFGSHANFPGPCPPPEDPDASHTVTIQGSFEETFGRNTQGWTVPARKPTGTYLAPGTIATVTVPPEIVDRGYQVRVGAHSWNLANRPPVRRLDRATRLYPIDDTIVKVASPYGGGIYIEVPFRADAGLIDVTVTGAVRAPYFSAKSFHETTLEEWLDTERHHPAPWADFQSDKFMMQVPTEWIYAHPDPVTLMADWDAAIGAMNDLMGFPRVRGKETMYCQVDVIMRASVHAPGYPAVNVVDNPNNERGGYHNNYLVRGPGNNYHGANIELHEQGHAYFFPKFGGEVESTVNLPHVPAMHRMFGYTLDEAFRGSLGFTNADRTLDNTAITWMTSFNFSPREMPMHVAEKSYQLKGHAKFVDIARLFGWDGFGDYWRSFMQDDADGVSYGAGTDDLLLRLSRNVGRDIRPLFHFWGIHPQNPASLGNAIAAENIPPSPEIFALLHHYKGIVPADNAAFREFGQGWWNKPEPNINGFWTETEHARQWDERIRRSGDGHIRTDITVGEMYVEACADQVRGRVQALIDLYFPGGSPDPEFVPAPYPDPMGFFEDPHPSAPAEIRMTALSASAIHQPVEYFFENTTTGATRDWSAARTWTEAGLTPNQTYNYRVKVRDALGNETGWSDPVEATTLDVFPPPTVASLHPAKGATVLELDTHLAVTFDLPVEAGSGFVTIRNLTDDTETPIDINDASQVSFSGNILTVHLPAELEFGKIHAVHISSGAVMSLDNVPFEGFTDDSAWDFSTSNLACPLGILNLAANGGINPATDAPWQPGDTYRLAFITSTDSYPSSDDIETYNAEMQALADASPLNLGDATWNVIGSTATVDARDNTGTNPNTNGPGHPIFLLDGSTVIAADNNELWSGTIRHLIDIMDTGETFDRTPWPYTGTRTDGTRRSGAGSDRSPFGAGGGIGQGTLTNNAHWVWRTNTSSTSDLPYYALSEPLAVEQLIAPTPPELLSITDDVSGGPVMLPDAIGYTLVFDRPMDPATIGADDFENATGTGVDIGGIAVNSDGDEVTLTVTPLEAGSVRLQIRQGAFLADVAGVPLDTGSVIADDSLITVLAGGNEPYAEWVAGFPALANPDPAIDFDGGGLANALEWVLGGDPTDASDDASIIPTLDNHSDPDFVIFTHRRTAEAAGDANTTIRVEYGSNLAGWTEAVAGPDVQIGVEPDAVEPGIDLVEVKIRRTLAADGKLFVRLNVVAATP